MISINLVQIKWTIILATILTASMAFKASGVVIEVPSSEFPIDDVIKSLEKRYKNDRKSVWILLDLGRLYTVKYVSDKSKITIESEMIDHGRVCWRQVEISCSHSIRMEMIRGAGKKSPVSKIVADKHLNMAKFYFQKAIEIAPNEHLAKLGYGWLLRESGQKTAAVKVFRSIIQEIWTNETVPITNEWYLAAGKFKKIKTEEQRRKELPPIMTSKEIFDETLEYFIPMLDTKKDAAEIKRLTDHRNMIQTLSDWDDSIRVKEISPIVIPLSDGLTAADIEDHKASVVFDLDGLNRKHHWTWIKKNAAWLVYRSTGSVAITSGRQLFGLVTFGLFWPNGYEALNSLDQDQDSQLTDDELSHLGLWHDVNGNGLFEANEFQWVRDAGITALACHYEFDTTHADQIPYSPSGVTWKNGRSWNTYDISLRR